jgi:hypothetical protein
MGVLAGVAIRRTIAAQSYAAFLAGSQVDPVSADFDALAALHTFRESHFRDRLEVLAIGKHLLTLPVLLIGVHSGLVTFFAFVKIRA